MPRRSGKSLLAEYEFSKDPDKTMFIGYNQNHLEHIDSFKNNKKNFFTMRSNFRGFKFEKAVIDEYLLFDLEGLKNAYQNLSLLGVENVFIFSSIDEVIENEFNFIKKCKSTGLYWKSDLDHDLYPVWLQQELINNKPAAEERLDKLHYNFLTDKDSVLIFKRNPIFKQLESVCFGFSKH